MRQVDLNENVFGWKASTHFYFHSTLLVFFSSFNFLAFFDYINLSQSAPNEAYEFLLLYFVLPTVIWWLTAVFFLFLLLCPDRVFYGIVCVVLAIFRIGFVSINYSGLSLSFFKLNLLTYFPYGRWSKFIILWGTLASDLYFCAVLFFLSFMYRPPMRAREPRPAPNVIIVVDKKKKVDEDEEEDEDDDIEDVPSPINSDGEKEEKSKKKISRSGIFITV